MLLLVLRTTRRSGTSGLLLLMGITDAACSQLSAFHIDGERLQESSRGSSTIVAVHFNVERTEPLLNVCASGVMATRNVLPGTLIDRIWVKREVPVRLWDGRTVMSRRWVTYAEARAEKLRITGFVGARK